jgi:ADP-ribose pyrophosphatase YjhB (NUDIX family)
LFSIGAFAIIFDEHDRVLLGHRRDLDVWNLPGGGVESGELPTEAVVRETKEETGLDVVVERLVGVYGKADKDDLVFAFACRVVGGRLSVTDEADESRYFKVENIPSNTAPRQVERIHDAINLSEQPIFRRQTAPSTRDLLQIQTRGQTL